MWLWFRSVFKSTQNIQKSFEEWAALPSSHQLYPTWPRCSPKTEKQSTALAYFAYLTANTDVCEILQLYK